MLLYPLVCNFSLWVKSGQVASILKEPCTVATEKTTICRFCPKKLAGLREAIAPRTFQETVTAADLGEANRIQPHTIETVYDLGVKSLSLTRKSIR